MKLIEIKRQAFFMLGVFLLFASCTQTKPTATAVNDTIVYVVRHAEKADASDPDTPLSNAGIVRAEALARKLANENVSRIYATTLQRTQQTVSPLAKAIGVTIVPLEPHDIGELVRRIKTDDKGTVIVVAGHSNTVPGIVQALNGTVVDPIEESQFDRLYKVVLSADGTSRVDLLHYGTGTP
ncbi:MAG: phosphoglycerate mutase family protein [Flavobacteriales bacterium]